MQPGQLAWAVNIIGEPGISGFGEKVQFATAFRDAPPLRTLKILVVSTPGLTRLCVTCRTTPGFSNRSLKIVMGVPVLALTRSNRTRNSSLFPLSWTPTSACSMWMTPFVLSMVVKNDRTKTPVGQLLALPHPHISPDWSIITALRTLGSNLTFTSNALIFVTVFSAATTSTVRPPPAPGDTTAVGLSEIRGCRAASVSAKYVA